MSSHIQLIFQMENEVAAELKSVVEEQQALVSEGAVDLVNEPSPAKRPTVEPTESSASAAHGKRIEQLEAALEAARGRESELQRQLQQAQQKVRVP